MTSRAQGLKPVGNGSTIDSFGQKKTARVLNRMSPRYGALAGAGNGSSGHTCMVIVSSR